MAVCCLKADVSDDWLLIYKHPIFFSMLPLADMEPAIDSFSATGLCSPISGFRGVVDHQLTRRPARMPPHIRG